MMKIWSQMKHWLLGIKYVCFCVDFFKFLSSHITVERRYRRGLEVLRCSWSVTESLFTRWFSLVENKLFLRLFQAVHKPKGLHELSKIIFNSFIASIMFNLLLKISCNISFSQECLKLSYTLIYSDVTPLLLVNTWYPSGGRVAGSSGVNKWYYTL